MGKGELMAETRKLTDGNKKTGMEDWARPEPLLKSLLFPNLDVHKAQPHSLPPWVPGCFL